MSGGVNEGSLCIPYNILDFIMIVIFPPLWVFIKELKSDNPMSNFIRIFICFILTSLFYFPGLMYALNIARMEGTIY